MKRMMLPLLLLGLFGCPQKEAVPEVGLVQQTGAPPTLTAELIDDDDRQVIRLSHGVAMGVGCWDWCDNQITSCQGFTINSADETVISVRDAYRASGQETRVLVAGAAGSTNLTVTTTCGSKTYRAVSLD